MSKAKRHHMTLFGRQVKPFDFTILIIMIAVFYFMGVAKDDEGPYTFSTDLASTHAGYASGIIAVILIVGFVINSRIWLQIGLLLSVFVFTARSVMTILSVGWDSFPLWVSIALAIGTAGAWVYERVHFDACPICGAERE